jgi:hypothetical protein
MPSPRRLGVLSLLAAAFHGADATCYYPSGREAPSDVPCRSDTPFSTCCGQGFVCLSNGLCQSTLDDVARAGAPEFVRGACTDGTWRSSNCPLFCVTDGVDFLDGDNGLLKCPGTDEDVYFCLNRRSRTDSSCEERKNVLIFAGMSSPSPSKPEDA